MNEKSKSITNVLQYVSCLSISQMIELELITKDQIDKYIKDEFKKDLESGK